MDTQDRRAAAAAVTLMLLTDAEWRRRARISKSTSIRWRKQGIGPQPIRTGPRAIRYVACEVDEFLGLDPEKRRSQAGRA